MYIITEPGKLNAETMEEVEDDQWRNHMDLVKYFGQKVSTIKLHSMRHAIAGLVKAGLMAEDLAMWFFERLNGLVKVGYRGTNGRAEQLATYYLRVMEMVSSEGLPAKSKQPITCKGAVSYERMHDLDAELVEAVEHRYAGEGNISFYSHGLRFGRKYTTDLYRADEEDKASDSDGFLYRDVFGEESRALLRVIVQVEKEEGKTFAFIGHSLTPTEVQPLEEIPYLKRVVGPGNEYLFVPVGDVLDNVFVFQTPSSIQEQQNHIPEPELWVSECIGKQCISHSPIKPNVYE